MVGVVHITPLQTTDFAISQTPSSSVMLPKIKSKEDLINAVNPEWNDLYEEILEW